MPAAHRVRQFIGALTARVGSQEQAIPQQYLNQAELALFRAMGVNDQRHALNVFYRLRKAGHDDADLLKAALLHDVAKARGRVGLVTRVAVVVLRRMDRRLVDRLANAQGPRWRRTLYFHAHHARIGADMAVVAGASPRTVQLIRGHGGQPADDLGRALYEADERS